MAADIPYIFVNKDHNYVTSYFNIYELILLYFWCTWCKYQSKPYN